MASWQEEPRVGQSIWHDYKNGVIEGIDWKERIVYVDYYDKGNGSFEYDELLGNFDEKLNQWVMPT